MARAALARRDEATLRGNVLAFPTPRNAPAPPTVPRERPPRPVPAPNGPFRVALVLSVVLHAAFLTGLEARHKADLARAAGSAVTQIVEGSADVIEVEIVVEASLPSAPAPTNATQPDAKTATAEPAAAEPEPKTLTAPPQTVAEDRAVKLSTVAPSPEAIPEPAASAAEAPMVEPPDPRAQETPKEKRTARTEAERTPTRSAPSAPSAAASPARRAASRTPGPGGSLGEIDTGGAALVSSYQALVLAHLQRFRTYPPEARDRGITGMPAVRFALAPDGRVLSASLARGSGADILDEAALAMVRRASPFPPFPAGLKRLRLEFAAPVRFDLR